MKRLFLVGIAALFLATGLFVTTSTSMADPASQSSPSAIERPMCDAPQDENGIPTEIPCDQLGVAYDCGQTIEADAEPDEIWINHGHIYSNLNSVTITVHLPNMASRKGRRYPVIHYDLETDEITLDGKPCHPVGG